MKYSVTVTGFDSMERSLARAAATTPGYVQTALTHAGDIVAQEVMRRMEREFRLARDKRTGALTMSVFHSKSPEAVLGENLMFGKLSDVPYAFWWEYGGSNKSPRGQAHRKFVPKGRTVYPSINAKFAEIQVLMEAVAERVARNFAGA